MTIKFNLYLTGTSMPIRTGPGLGMDEGGPSILAYGAMDVNF